MKDMPCIKEMSLTAHLTFNVTKAFAGIDFIRVMTESRCTISKRHLCYS